MTEDELQEIEVRLQEATSGPYAIEASGDGYFLCAGYPGDPNASSNDMVIAKYDTIDVSNARPHSGFDADQAHANVLFAVYAYQDTPRLIATIRAERTENARLKAALEVARPTHYVSTEDCWYSCPKSGECCNDGADVTKCNCGADFVKQAIDEALGMTRGGTEGEGTPTPHAE